MNLCVIFSTIRLQITKSLNQAIIENHFFQCYNILEQALDSILEEQQNGYLFKRTIKEA